MAAHIVQNVNVFDPKWHTNKRTSVINISLMARELRQTLADAETGALDGFLRDIDEAMERVRVGEATAAHLSAALRSATPGAAVSVGRVNDGPLISEQAPDGTWREMLPTPATPDEIADMKPVPGQLPPSIGDRALFDEAVSELPLVKREKAAARVRKPRAMQLDDPEPGPTPEPRPVKRRIKAD